MYLDVYTTRLAEGVKFETPPFEQKLKNELNHVFSELTASVNVFRVLLHK
jgi:hypothetical protein